MRQNGTALIVGTVSMVLVVPMIGLAVDVGIIYALKAQLQASVDGASLAAARALSLSANTASQVIDAQHNANNWFYSNFPNNYWGAISTDMAPDDTHVHVYDDATNPHLRHVDVTAAIDAPNYFMRWFGSPTTHIIGKGFASRRDVVAMLVLDRSGSMGSACSGLIDAAKLFTGQFTAGRDMIGAVSFADNAYLHSVPTTNFRTALGFNTSVGATGSNTGTGELDTITCGGGTNTASAISMAYNELYKVAEPGALNVIVFETDGHPNTITLNFADINYGTSTLNAVALASGSGCRDQNSKTIGGGGFATFASIPTWQGTPSHVLTTLATGQAAAPYYSSTQPGPAYYTSDVPPGMVGALGGTDTGNTAFLLFKSWTTVKTNTYEETSNQYVVPPAPGTGCTFAGSHNSLSDFAWLPTTDVYGNNLNTSYDPVTTATLNGGTRISPVNMTQIRAAAFNAVDDAAHRFRTNASIPVTFYAVGFNSADTTLMQRVANDPDWIGNAACTAQCQYDSTQPTGKYVYASTTSALNGAFQALASQILRLAQ
ncbi:MAG TPA: vWA domain-containing protein [Bryobacteraceae bacterium]|nr:vWA domain-containing protein [Bryobacteraceae bacterium]